MAHSLLVLRTQSYSVLYSSLYCWCTLSIQLVRQKFSFKYGGLIRAIVFRPLYLLYRLGSQVGYITLLRQSGQSFGGQKMPCHLLYESKSGLNSKTQSMNYL